MKLKSLDSTEFITCRHPDELVNMLSKVTCLIGHNIYGYDLPVLEKVWGIDYGHNRVLGKTLPIWDTLLMSQYVEPDLPGHSLDEWGKRLGRLKIDYRAALVAKIQARATIAKIALDICVLPKIQNVEILNEISTCKQSTNVNGSSGGDGVQV